MSGMFNALKIARICHLDVWKLEPESLYVFTYCLFFQRLTVQKKSNLPVQNVREAVAQTSTPSGSHGLTDSSCPNNRMLISYCTQLNPD